MQEFTECSARQEILEQQLIDCKGFANRGDKLGLGKQEDDNATIVFKTDNR